MNQKTIKNSIKIIGVGIHSGKTANMKLNPAPDNTGIIFIRTDKNNTNIPVNINSKSIANRATILQNKSVQIHTPEHLLAACYILGINNLYIEIDSEEVPILDGSAIDYIKSLKKAGIEEQSTPNNTLVLTTPLQIKEDDKQILILPNKIFKISFVLEYPDSFIGIQDFSLEINQKTFIKEIAPARTYGFESEIQTLFDQGLAKGGNLNNTLVIGENKYLNPQRFQDEPVRHKILDLIGDLSILGKQFTGHIIATKSGHNLNLKMVEALSKL
jgi:UDP-3-O-acyl N-acetylglucosamine deacetylase